MKKNTINIIIFSIAVFSIPVFITLFFLLKSVICLLLATFSTGYSIVESIKFIKKRNELDFTDFAMLGFEVITIFFTFVPCERPPIKEQLNRLYFPKDSIIFEKEIFTRNSTQNFLKFIFAFDNSGEGLTDVIDKNLQGQFNDYCNKIETFGNWANNEKDLIQNFRGNEAVFYGNLLKARLCFDLIQKINNNGEFVIIKIGDPSSSNFKNDLSNFKTLTIDNIQYAIKKIVETTNNEFNTNFETFNTNLKNYKTNKKTNEQIILHTYSDFFHDCQGEETHLDIRLIQQDKREIIKGTVHNCFIDRHHRHKRGGRYILDSKPDFEYETFFYLDSINKDVKVPVRRIFINNLWFYSQKYNEDIRATLHLIFPKCEKYIISHITNDKKGNDKKEFSMNGKTVDNGSAGRFGSNDNTITLQYEGKKLPNEKTLFEVVHEDVHYYVYFDFIKEWDKSGRYWLPIIAFTLGILMGLFNLKNVR